MKVLFYHSGNDDYDAMTDGHVVVVRNDDDDDEEE